MKLKYILGIFISIFLLLSSPSTPSATAQASTDSELRVLSSGPQEIVLALTVPDFQVETILHAGETYQRLIVAGTTQTLTPGEPQVPQYGALVGLPGLTDVSVEIIEAAPELQSGYHLYPAPDQEMAEDNLIGNVLIGDVQETFALNEARYATNAFYPEQPVEFDYTGQIRDQAVAQVQFYPVQYNPVTGEVRFYSRLVVRLTWDAPLSVATAAQADSPAVENLLSEMLLNYDDLGRSVAVTASSTGQTGLVGTASNDTVKIGITDDGLYQLTYNDLTAAGFNLTGVDPRQFTMTNQGNEIAIEVLGEDDGVFDPADVILFYGTGIADDVYTAENVYWLAVGDDNGLRLVERDGTPAGATVPDQFPNTTHAEKDTLYWVTMPNGAGQDHWLWDERISPNTGGLPTFRDVTLTLNNIAPTTTVSATVRVQFKGYTFLDHRTKIYVNGNEVDDQTWSGQSAFLQEAATVPHNLLVEGANTIRIEAVDSGASVDQTFINWVELDYQDTFVAENNELLFGASAAGSFQFEVTGYSSSDIDVFDVTNPASVARIINGAITTNGGTTISFQETAQAESRYLALTAAQRKSPDWVELDEFSFLKSSSNGADYIIITHDDFYNNALTLANHRQSPDLRVITVKIEDIYDEFNHGIANPQAVRDFLDYTYENWVSPAPTYVLLLGDSTFDFKDNLDTGIISYIPAPIIETQAFGQVPSDNWFVTFKGDDILPEMFVGRLVAQSVAEAERMVNKIIAYEQSPPDDTWNNRVTLVADDDTTSYAESLNMLAATLPGHYATNKVYVVDYPPGDPTSQIVSHINEGSMLTTYAGHGSAVRWGRWTDSNNQSQDIFSLDNLASLNNTDKLSVITIANCLNGFFSGVSTTGSLAEEFLRVEGGGAVAVWAPSSLGFPSGHRAIQGEFYEAVFKDKQYALGAATTTAKIDAYAQNPVFGELVTSFILFGDPAMKLGLSTKSVVYLPYIVKFTLTKP